MECVYCCDEPVLYVPLCSGGLCTSSPENFWSPESFPTVSLWHLWQYPEKTWPISMATRSERLTAGWALWIFKLKYLGRKVAFSPSGQPSLKRLFHILFGVFTLFIKFGRSFIWKCQMLHWIMAVIFNADEDTWISWWGGGGGGWPRHMCHPHQPSAVCSSRSHTPSFCGMWSTHRSVMGFQGQAHQIQEFPSWLKNPTWTL